MPQVEPAPEPTTSTTFVPGGPDDPSGPILCPALRHPAHHKPCPSPVATNPTPTPPNSTSTVSAPDPAPLPATASALLACIRSFEQGAAGYATDTGNTFYGAYQFTLGTWRSVGGTGNPADAPPEEQDDRAWKLYLRDGLGPWPTPAVKCRHLAPNRS